MGDETSDKTMAIENTELFEKLLALVELAHDSIIIRDLENRITFWNRGAEEKYGWKREEVLGNLAHSLLQTQFSQPLEEVEQTLHRNHYWEGEVTHTGKNGKRIVVATRRVLQCDSEGKPTAILEINNDITDRKRAEQALKEQAELIELAHDSIIVRDTEGRIMFWNRGAEEKYGWTRAEALGKVTHSFLQTQFPQPFPEVERELLERHYWEGELVHTTKTGKRITVASRQVLQCDAQGKPTAILEINNDITDRKQAEQALNRSEERLRMLFEFSPDAMITSNSDGIITQVNTQVEKFFGYQRAELLGQSVDLLVPERFRASHPAHRRDYNAHPRTRQMGAGLELLGKRKDGTEFPIDIMLAPIETAEGRVVLSTIRDLSEKKEMEAALKRSEQQRSYLEEELETTHQFEEIVGESPALKRVLKQVEDVAPTDATVLILGETGTGKELIARAIHDLSPRRDHAFIKLNCSAIPSGLLESELFGHEKGAFTGAIAQKIGRLELAHQGTFFLDEVGDLPLELQPKILRALQEKEFERVGGTRTIPVNVRLVAATNRDLAKMVKAGQFRSDLYYRLHVFPITIPPLRERRDDIPLLVRYFLSSHSKRMARRIETIPAETMQKLIKWRWPGNIRELENFMERSVILTQGSVLRAPLAELETVDESTSSTTSNLEAKEREHILRVLRECKGMIGGAHGAAERLGLKRTTLNSKMKKLNIKRRDYI